MVATQAIMFEVGMIMLVSFIGAALATKAKQSVILGYIVAGAILIETVFSYHGIGSAVYDAVHQRDYPMLQGAFLILTVSVVFFNFLADLIYFKLDPRITT